MESKDGEGDEEEPEEEYEDEGSKEPGAGSSSGGGLPGHSLLEQLADALVDGVSAILLTDSEDESRALASRGVRSLDHALQQLSTGTYILSITPPNNQARTAIALCGSLCKNHSERELKVAIFL